MNNFVIPFSRVEEKWEKNGVGGKPREFHVGYVNFEFLLDNQVEMPVRCKLEFGFQHKGLCYI